MKAPTDKLARRGHVPVLVLVCFVLVAAFCLQVTPDDRVALFVSEEAKLPPLCMTNTLLNLPCPGCGLTRSFVHLAHGDFAASFRSHRLGWVFFALFASQIPYRLAQMYRPFTSEALMKFTHWFVIVLLVLMLGNWVVNLTLFR